MTDASYQLLIGENTIVLVQLYRRKGHGSVYDLMLVSRATVAGWFDRFRQLQDPKIHLAN